MRVFFLYSAFLAFFLVLCLTGLYYFKSLTIYFVCYRTFIAAEFVTLSYFFIYNIKSTKLSSWIKFSIIPFILLSIYDYLFISKIPFSFYPQVLEGIIFIFIITYLFYEKMNTDLTIPIYNLPIFWISFAFLIYFSGSFFLFLYSKNFSDDLNFKRLYHLVYGTVTITKNLFLCIGIYLTKYVKDPTPSSDQLANLDLDHFNPTDKWKTV